MLLRVLAAACLLFFFPRRRRHTRCLSDWSSDVCSSDIREGVPVTLADLKVGDYVVHAVHGIGQYLGLRTETILGAIGDYMDLKYAGTDRMLVPVHQMH